MAELDNVSEILFDMKLFEGNTLLQFNKLDPVDFTREERSLIDNMLHTFNEISKEGLATAEKTNDPEEIDKWTTLSSDCQTAVNVWHGTIQCLYSNV